MNAPTTIAPQRDRYLPIITHHLPGCTGTELQLRCSILLMRDKASSNLRRCSDEAAPVLEHVVRLAHLHAFSCPAAELDDLRYRLVQLTMCASGLEQFAYRMSGGADAGG